MEAPQPPSVTRRAHNAQGCDPLKKSALYMWSWIIWGIECMEVLALCWLNILVTQGQSRPVMATVASCQQIQLMIFASSSVSYIKWLGFYFTLLFFIWNNIFVEKKRHGKNVWTVHISMKPFPTMVLFYIWVGNQLKPLIELITR